jgi:hypothetical protein
MRSATTFSFPSVVAFVDQPKRTDDGSEFGLNLRLLSGIKQPRMKLIAFSVSKLAVAALLGASIVSQPAAALAQDKEPLALKLPMPTLKGTPEQLPEGATIEPMAKDMPKPFVSKQADNTTYVTSLNLPKGAKNVAEGKTVTSSVAPFTGELTQITDGQKEAFDDQAVEFKKGTQWVQIDLGAPVEIAAIAIWHDHRYVQLFKSVIVQASNDPEFKEGVVTLYNNDTENASGLGIGTDKQYFETRFGRVIDGKGTKARYLRSYSKGSNQSAINTVQEIEIYGLPAK